MRRPMSGVAVKASNYPLQVGTGETAVHRMQQTEFVRVGLFTIYLFFLKECSRELQTLNNRIIIPVHGNL